MNILKRINWWTLLVLILIFAGSYGIGYVLYLFVKLIGKVTLG